jgi:hypothetical protein
VFVSDLQSPKAGEVFYFGKSAIENITITVLILACQLIGIDSHVDNHQRRTHFYGAWMRDGRRRDTRYYITEHYMGQYIFEYANRSDFVRALPAVVHQLPDVTFDGTNHVVFSRAFYFHRTGTNRIARYPLDDDAGELRERPINDALFRGQVGVYFLC